MAKLKGILKIEGTIGEMTFYKTQDGNLVRGKGGISASRIANDPEFVRTRENGAEFGGAATSGKLVKNAFRSMVSKSSDNRVTSRLTQVMTKIKDLDSKSIRGERSVANGIATVTGRQLLKAFNFNIHSVLGSILHVPYTVDVANARLDIANFMAANDLTVPPAATDYSLQAAFAVIDFSNGVTSVEYTNIQSGVIDNNPVSVNLTSAIPAGKGTSIAMLQVEFFQEVNGALYSLNNGAFNALAIVDVA